MTGTGPLDDRADDAVRLLVVGDDPAIVELLVVTLRSAGYQVRNSKSGAEAVAAERWVPDLVLQDGFEVTRHVRGHPTQVPAIFLTPGDQVEGTVPGLTIGGGDYVFKPFSPEELRANVRMVLRRASHNPKLRPRDDVLRYADLELGQDTYYVRRAGRPIHLSLTEFSLLRFLMRNADEIVTRAQILEHVWHYGYAGNETVVEGYIWRLRRKVDDRGPPLINTIRGVGYSLRLSAGPGEPVVPIG